MKTQNRGKNGKGRDLKGVRAELPVFRSQCCERAGMWASVPLQGVLGPGVGSPQVHGHVWCYPRQAGSGFASAPGVQRSRGQRHALRTWKAGGVLPSLRAAVTLPELPPLSVPQRPHLDSGGSDTAYHPGPLQGSSELGS